MVFGAVHHFIVDMIRHWELLRSLAAKEFKVRYKNAVLGFLWTILNPLLLMAVLSVVFHFIDPRWEYTKEYPFPMFLLCGLIPWTFMAHSLSQSTASLLDNAQDDLSGERIGLYSYGSGCVGEFFSGVVQPGFREWLYTDRQRNLLENRTELTYQQYEDIFNYGVPDDGGEYVFPQYRTGPFRFSGISRHKREYESLVD